MADGYGENYGMTYGGIVSGTEPTPFTGEGEVNIEPQDPNVVDAENVANLTPETAGVRRLRLASGPMRGRRVRAKK